MQTPAPNIIHNTFPIFHKIVTNIIKKHKITHRITLTLHKTVTSKYYTKQAPLLHITSFHCYTKQSHILHNPPPLLLIFNTTQSQYYRKQPSAIHKTAHIITPYMTLITTKTVTNITQTATDITYNSHQHCIQHPPLLHTILPPYYSQQPLKITHKHL